MSGLTTRRILLIEDNPADVFLIKEALRSYEISFELEWMPDGEQAVARIEQKPSHTGPPDLILLDLNLPKIDGKEVLRRIRGVPQLAQTPVAILTSSDSPHDRRDTARLGANCYIKKPPTLDEFMSLGGKFRDLLEAHD